MPSILRRRKSHQKITRDSPLRPSLSLPDITSPLLDTATWEWDEVPDLLRSTAVPVSSATISTPPSASAGRHRAPSLVRDKTNSPVQFHRPFTPWQVVDASSPLPKINPGMMAGGKGDFRDTNKWRASTVSSIARGIDGKKRARGRGKVLESMNVVVAGGKGSGKTSLVKLLIDSFSSSTPTRHPSQTAHTVVKPPSPGSTPASPTSPGPPVSAGLASITENLPPPSASANSAFGPTKRLTSEVVDAAVDGHEAVKLRLIDTPGLNLSSDLVASKARERGVSGLLRLMEERFEETLKEESRIIRTRKRQEDGMVHLVLYLIDARSVLNPSSSEDDDEDVDWTCFGLFDDKPTSTSTAAGGARAEPNLDITEIAVIRRLATRANVVPVLSQTDALTTSQLRTARQVVRRDLAKVFGDEQGKGFGIIGTMLEDEHRPDTPDLSSSSESDERPLTPRSLSDTAAANSLSDALPFAIFCPEPATTGAGSMTREYPWGAANVMDPRHGDFVALRQAVLGTYASALRTHTKEKLYESYRTERLLAQKERAQKA